MSEKRASDAQVKVISTGPLRGPVEVLRDPPKFRPPPVEGIMHRDIKPENVLTKNCVGCGNILALGYALDTCTQCQRSETAQPDAYEECARICEAYGRANIAETLSAAMVASHLAHQIRTAQRRPTATFTEEQHDQALDEARRLYLENIELRGEVERLRRESVLSAPAPDGILSREVKPANSLASALAAFKSAMQEDDESSAVMHALQLLPFLEAPTFKRLLEAARTLDKADRATGPGSDEAHAEAECAIWDAAIQWSRATPEEGT